MSLIQITPPSITPVDKNDIKPAARIDGDEFDTQLDIVIPAITQAVEAKMGRKLINQTMELALNSFPPCSENDISLLLPNASSIASVKYLDALGVEQTLSPSAYRLTSSDHDSKISLTGDNAWPATARQPAAVRIRFICGYGATADSVPNAIRLWIISQCIAAINNPDGLAGKELASMEYVDALLQPFTLWRIA